MFAPRLLVSPDLVHRAALVGLAPARSARPVCRAGHGVDPETTSTDGITQRDIYRIAQLEDSRPRAQVHARSIGGTCEVYQAAVAWVPHRPVPHAQVHVPAAPARRGPGHRSPRRLREFVIRVRRCSGRHAATLICVMGGGSSSSWPSRSPRRPRTPGTGAARRAARSCGPATSCSISTSGRTPRSWGRATRSRTSSPRWTGRGCCACGCGELVPVQRDFLSGHDGGQSTRGSRGQAASASSWTGSTRPGMGEPRLGTSPRAPGRAHWRRMTAAQNSVGRGLAVG
jgi:hypothetical protein